MTSLDLRTRRPHPVVSTVPSTCVSHGCTPCTHMQNPHCCTACDAKPALRMSSTHSCADCHQCKLSYSHHHPCISWTRPPWALHTLLLFRQTPHHRLTAASTHVCSQMVCVGNTRSCASYPVRTCTRCRDARHASWTQALQIVATDVTTKLPS